MTITTKNNFYRKIYELSVPANLIARLQPESAAYRGERVEKLGLAMRARGSFDRRSDGTKKNRLSPIKLFGPNKEARLPGALQKSLRP
jgi:hypothetical protein